MTPTDRALLIGLVVGTFLGLVTAAWVFVWIVESGRLVHRRR